MFLYGKLKIAGFAVLLFSGQLDDGFTPIYQSSAKFTLVSDYKERVGFIILKYCKVGDHFKLIFDNKDMNLNNILNCI